MIRTLIHLAMRNGSRLRFLNFEPLSPILSCAHSRVGFKFLLVYVSLNDGPYTLLRNVCMFAVFLPQSTAEVTSGLENRWLLCWNSTSGFDLDPTVVIGT